MKFGPASYTKSEDKIVFGGVEIERVSSMKYLGAQLTDNLDPTQHGEVRREKLINSTFALKCIGIDSAQLLPKMRLFFYKTYCRPIIWYGTECFNLTKTEVDK